jgi:hypothetical protein
MFEGDSTVEDPTAQPTAPTVLSGSPSHASSHVIPTTAQLTAPTASTWGGSASCASSHVMLEGNSTVEDPTAQPTAPTVPSGSPSHASSHIIPKDNSTVEGLTAPTMPSGFWVSYLSISSNLLLNVNWCGLT